MVETKYPFNASQVLLQVKASLNIHLFTLSNVTQLQKHSPKIL